MKESRLYSLFLVILTTAFFFSCKENKESVAGRRTADGSIIVETGELAAVNSRSVVVSRYGRQWSEMKIVGLLNHGEIVKKGDSIAQLDPAEIKKYILERESYLETQLAILEKLYVEQENKKQESASRIKNETATFDLRKIEWEASRFESERIQKIKQLEYEQAVINLEKEKKIFDLHKIINSSELKVQEIRVEQIKKDIENAENLIPLLTLHAPVSGVFQIALNRQNSNRNIYKIGDNIYAGNNLAIVPELEFMKVNTQINETDFLKVSLNQKVAVRLDAMPKVVFEGEVVYIGKLCRLKDQKSRQKVFDVEVKILNPDERLKPGMTVSCEYI